MTVPTVLDGLSTCAGGLVVGPLSFISGRAQLRGWWRVSDLSGIADGAAVTTWPDASGNGHDFVVDSGLTAEPIIDSTVTLNGQRGLKFSPDIDRDSMSAPGEEVFPECTRAGTIFYLLRRHTAASAELSAGGPVVGFLGSGRVNGTHWPFTDGLTYDGNLRHSQSRVNSISVGAWTSTTRLVEVSSSAADEWRMRIDGTQVASATHSWPNGTIGGVVDTGITEFRIGGNVANTFYGHPAHYWEVIAYDGVLTSAERSEVHAHLNSEYGLALPAT